MSRWKGIVLHHSATTDSNGVETEGFRRFHVEVRGWLDIGYHFVIEEIDDRHYALMGRPAYMSGAHCPGKNSTHLGICFTGNFGEEEMKEEQIEAGARLITSLCVMNDIDPSQISRHSDWRDTACPGSKFPFSELIERVKREV